MFVCIYIFNLHLHTYSGCVGVAQFRSELISENVLQKLLRQDIIVNFHLTDPHSSDCFIYTAGKPCDYFVMILQGRVEVEFVKDAIVFEGGPFTFFGIQTLQGISLSYSYL